MAEIKDYNKYVFVGLFIIFIYLSFRIVEPFVAALLTSGVLAYIFYPVYRKLHSKIGHENISAMLVSLLIIILITFPLFMMINTISNEARDVYTMTTDLYHNGEMFNLGCSENSTNLICLTADKVGDLVENPGVRKNVDESLDNLARTVSQKASDIVLSIPAMILNIFITFFTTFYLFKGGKKLVVKIQNLLPFPKKYRKDLMKELDDSAEAVIYGSLLIAAIQGAVGAIGFIVLGISSPLLWGILMAIFALLPTIGTAIVWFPIAVIMILQGLAIGNNSALFKGVALLLYGMFIIGSIDNIIKPSIIGKTSKIHPVLVLIGVLGGIAVFGFIGFIVGPLILAMLMSLIEVYEKMHAEELKK